MRRRAEGRAAAGEGLGGSWGLEGGRELGAGVSGGMVEGRIVMVFQRCHWPFMSSFCLWSQGAEMELFQRPCFHLPF